MVRSYGGGVAKGNTLRFLFQRLRSANFHLQNMPRERPKTKVDSEEQNAVVKTNASQSTSEVAAGCEHRDKIALIHLKQIGQVKNLERSSLKTS